MVPLILAASLLIRLLFVPFTPFGNDEITNYRIGAELLLTGALPLSGPAVVYTGTTLPGGLMGALVGLPLLATQGFPSSAVVFLAFWQWFAMVLTYLFYRVLFPGFPRAALCAWVLLSPWSILFTNLWNPNYLPLLSILFCFGLYRLFELARAERASRTHRAHNNALIAGILLGLPPVLALQLHLSFVLFPLWLAALTAMGIIAWRTWLRPRLLAGLAIGVGLGAIPLLPTWIKSASPGTGVGTDFLFANTQWRWEAVWDIPKVFFRFLSFPTAETSRFFSDNGSFIGAWRWLSDYPLLAGLYALALLVSAWIFWHGLRFYWLMFRGKLQKPRAAESALAPWDRAIFALPWVTAATFFFSVKDASAHTFWIWLPLSFYPALRAIDSMNFASLRAKSNANSGWGPAGWAIAGYCTLACMVPLAAYILKHPDNIEKIENTVRAAESARDGAKEKKPADASSPGFQQNLLSKDHFAVREILEIRAQLGKRSN